MRLPCPEPSSHSSCWYNLQISQDLCYPSWHLIENKAIIISSWNINFGKYYTNTIYKWYWVISKDTWFYYRSWRLMLYNCDAREDSWESLGLQGDQTHQSSRKSTRGRTDVEAEAPIFWPPDRKSQIIGKDPDARKDLRQEEKGVTENEMVRWHHWLDGREFEHILGASEGKPGVLQSMGSQRAGYDWASEQQLLQWRPEGPSPPTWL